MARIYLFSHGKTTTSVGMLFYGVTHCSLAPEALEKMEIISKPPVDIVFSSPLSCCAEYAKHWGFRTGYSDPLKENKLREKGEKEFSRNPKTLS